MPKTETDFDHQLKTYDHLDKHIEDGQPVEDSRYAGGVGKQSYSQKSIPVFFKGIIRNTSGGPVKKMSFLEGFHSFWDAFTSYASAAISTSIGQILNFFNFNNSMDASLIVTDTSVNSTSQAAFTLTVPANHVYRVKIATIKNTTRLSTTTCDFTPNGGTAAQIVDTGVGGAPAGETAYCIGSNGSDVAVPSYAGELWMQAGDTLTMTSGNFVAADVMEHNFVFDDFTVT